MHGLYKDSIEKALTEERDAKRAVDELMSQLADLDPNNATPLQAACISADLLAVAASLSERVCGAFDPEHDPGFCGDVERVRAAISIARRLLHPVVERLADFD